MSHEMTGPQLAHTWHYWRVDAEGKAVGPRRTVRAMSNIDVETAASLAAEQEHDEDADRAGLRSVGDRADNYDGIGQTFEFEMPDGSRPKRLRVTCRVRFDYSEVRPL